VGDTLTDEVLILFGTSAGTFQGGLTSYSVGQDPRHLAMGDLNSDGQSDLVAGCETGEEVYVLIGAEGGTFTVSSYPAGGRVGAIALGDVNMDGNLDLVASLGNQERVSVLLGAEDGTLAAPHLYETGENPAGLALLDVDGDNRLDVVTTGRGNVTALLGTGDGKFERQLDYGAGLWPMGAAAGDVDHDGDADLAVTDAYYDSVWVLENRTAPQPRLFKGDLFDPIQAGNDQRYVIIVTNPRQSPITQVVLTDTLPPGLDYVSADPLPKPVQKGSPIVTWQFERIEPGQEIAIRLRAHTRSSMGGGTVFTNTIALNCAECVSLTAVTTSTIQYFATPTPTPLPHRWFLPMVWVGPK